MVGAINSTNVVNQATSATKNADIKRLVRYTNNEIIQDNTDTFSSAAKGAVGSAMLFEGIPLFNLLRRNKKNGGKFISQDMIKLGNEVKAKRTTIMSGEGKLGSKIKSFIEYANNDSKKEFSAIKEQAKKDAKAAKKGTVAKAVEEVVEETTEKVAKSNVFKNATTKIQQSKVVQTAGKAKEVAKKAAGNATSTVKKVAENATATVKKVAPKTTSKLGKLGKYLKSSGAGIMLAFSGILEATTEVIPTFKELGAKKGVKQIGKSAVKVVGDTVGFIAGEQLGVAAGTAIGTAIFPGIGTAVGAVCGFIGGILGSFVAGKVTKAVVGKPEREIAKEQQEEAKTNQIANDTASLESLKNSAMAKIQENAKLYNGQLSEDDYIALQSLENLGATNPFSM